MKANRVNISARRTTEIGGGCVFPVDQRAISFDYHGVVKTRHIVTYLIGRRDQVASVRDIADALNDFSPDFQSTIAALRRLEKVNRVAEFHPGLWHLE